MLPASSSSNRTSHNRYEAVTSLLRIQSVWAVLMCLYSIVAMYNVPLEAAHAYIDDDRHDMVEWGAGTVESELYMRTWTCVSFGQLGESFMFELRIWASGQKFIFSTWTWDFFLLVRSRTQRIGSLILTLPVWNILCLFYKLHSTKKLLLSVMIMT